MMTTTTMHEILGEETDHYDAAAVFGDEAAPGGRARNGYAVEAVRAIVRQAQRSRLPPPPLEVKQAAQVDPRAPFTLDDTAGEIARVLGDVGISATSTGKPAAFAPTHSTRFPILHGIYRRFAAAMPAAKRVRVDDEASCAAFRDARRAPYIAELERRVAALEAAFAAHASDGHGGQLSETDKSVDVLGAEVEAAADAVACGGVQVPLSLEPWAKGKVEHWQDGGEILCSIRVLGLDGKVRIITTGTPVSRHTEEALGYAIDAGVDVVEVMGVMPALAQIFGAGSLIPQLAAAAPDLLLCCAAAGQPVVCEVRTASDPALSAAMMLQQLCERGDEAACTEAIELRRIPEGAALLDEAGRGLAAMRQRRLAP